MAIEKPTKKVAPARRAAAKSAAKTPAKRARTIRRPPAQKHDAPAVTPEPIIVASLEAEAPEPYWAAIGRRKTATARVRLFTKGDKSIIVNGKPYGNYFPYPQMQQTAREALDLMNSLDRFRVSVKVSGGGLAAQAEAIRHATARALILFNQDFRKRLKRAGFLTRDPRMKERRKFSLKKARKAPQWAKR
jgi:small subunit ribosomal protein S9